MIGSGTLERTGEAGRGLPLPSDKSGCHDRRVMSVVRRFRDAVAALFLLVWLCIVLTQADEQLYVAGLLLWRPMIAYVPLVSVFLVLVVLTLGLRSTVAELATLTRCNLPVLLPFLVLTSVALLWSQMRNAYWYDGGKYIYLYAYNFAVFLSALTIPMLPVFRRSWRVYLGAALLVLVASIYYDILFPGTFTTLELRAAGFPQNANFSAFFATILCASIVRYGRVQALEILIICVTAVAVVATFWRGGLLAFCLFLGVL
jgi:hypothetical protein